MSMNKWKLALAAASAIILPLTFAASAEARGTSGSVTTTDSGIAGGTGFFWYDGNGAQPANKSVIGARDNQADGKGVWVRVSWARSPYAAIVMDTNGASNGVVTKVVTIPDGTPVTLEVCLRDSDASPTLRYCNSRDFVA
ncbi:hypothetical protein [Streptomyces sp. NPDC002187]|uniref:hypothetical protein n=1 Tax=Streptomyces sp. NPDC002187 TaxID=3364637 RepID=UPI00369F8F51